LTHKLDQNKTTRDTNGAVATVGWPVGFDRRAKVSPPVELPSWKSNGTPGGTVDDATRGAVE